MRFAEHLEEASCTPVKRIKLKEKIVLNVDPLLIVYVLHKISRYFGIEKRMANFISFMRKYVSCLCFVL